MTQHLLHIHIGPMQEFIAAARRTRDLWFGSWLMSELSKAAAKGVADHNSGNRLIFPAQGSDLNAGSDLGVSNRIAAQVTDPEKAAQAAKAALDERYKHLIMAVLSAVDLEETARQRAEKQLHSFLEFYWVSQPVNGDYAQARQYADALLAARKSTRNFQPVDWGGVGLPKSSLDGRMETVIPPKLGAKKMYGQFRARSGEQLSGVDLLKRLGEKDNPKSRFPSTSHMAAMPLKARLEAAQDDPHVQRAWHAYLQKLPAEVQQYELVHHQSRLPLIGDLDGGLLFESRLLDFIEKGETIGPKAGLKAFLKAAGLGEPNPYYALLVGDGDSMGKAINKMHTADEHRAFSQKLAQFAEEARAIVTEHDGVVVYAGGDDVLALLPLHTAVGCTATLSQTFCAMMGNNLTFSAGIAIIHHLEPLEDALNLARQAEKEAKSLADKNALAITLNKRSGAPRTIVGRWGELDVRLTQFAAFYAAKELPHGLAYQLRDMYLHLGGRLAVKENPTLQAVIREEAQRIIARKEGNPDAAIEVAAAVAALDHDQTTIETLSNELIIAAHIAQAQELAKLEEFA